MPKVFSPDYASILYCRDEIIRRAVRTACATRKAGTPDPQAGTPSLLNVPYSTFAEADPQAGAPARGAALRSALSSLRDKNLCLNRARTWGGQGTIQFWEKWGTVAFGDARHCKAPGIELESPL